MPDFSLTYTQLPEVFYREHQARPLDKTLLVFSNDQLAQKLGLTDWMKSEEAPQILAGAKTIDNIQPVAMAYCGHQFGHWSGMLGDGRAALFAEIQTPDQQRFDLHLKGCGVTHYSRGGDGNATLGAAIRELLIGEAMHGLGIPTSRALAVAATGMPVYREEPEPGAVVSRVASGHVRVGTFQLAAASGDVNNIKALAEFVIERHYSHLAKHDYLGLLREVMRRQAQLIAKWMHAGFIHGVMNTDNMLICGETIDFGPCAFIDEFHPGKVFSSIDRNGRYAWNKQGNIGLWNLTRLAETLVPLLTDGDDEKEDEAIEQVKAVLADYEPLYYQDFYNGFCSKLGLDEITLDASNQDKDVQSEQRSFIDHTFEIMMQAKADFTLFFRHLTKYAQNKEVEPLLATGKDPKLIATWLNAWQQHFDTATSDAKTRIEKMLQANPIYIARNHRVEEAIQAANNGDLTPTEQLLKALKDPFVEQPELAYLELAPLDNEIVQQTFCGT